MTAETLLTDLKAKGVMVSVADGVLRLRAPCGVLTPFDRAAVTAQKRALIALLNPDRERHGRTAEPDGKTTEVTVADAMEVFPGSCVVADKQPPAWPLESGYVPEEGQRHRDARFGPRLHPGPCPACGLSNYYRAGDGWTCSMCHPLPWRSTCSLARELSRPANRLAGPPADAWVPTSARTIDVYAAEMLTAACHCCGATAWFRVGSVWACAKCHPAPARAHGQPEREGAEE
jgi:ribosomal protein L37AE/L43A